mgnify:CR=1 FL=1
MRVLLSAPVDVNHRISAAIPLLIYASLIADFPLGDWLIENSLWSDAEHVIGAAEANVDEARLLKIAPGAACLIVERRTWTRGAPVTAVRFAYPGGGHRLVGRFSPPVSFGRRS